MTEHASIVDWLLAGDPAIRWQAMRDLTDAPEHAWRAERSRVATDGWGAAILSRQAVDGSWPKGRWTDTTWTLLTLIECGVPGEGARLAQAADALLSKLLPRDRPVDARVLETRLDLCHVGFWLRIGATFLPGDGRLGALVRTILALQLADGGWNCRVRNRPSTTHGSFHTTFNVLEGLRAAVDAGVFGPAIFGRVEARAIEFMLDHRMYRSDKTGLVVDEAMTRLTFPWHWHYTVLRGLDYVRTTRYADDARLADARLLIAGRRRANGRWPSDRRIPGATLFDLEKPGGDSRWSTLRALRVLGTTSKEEVRP